jgi:hypothetical protein
MQLRIIEIIPLLVELGRSADRSVIEESQLPNSSDFGVLWTRWGQVVKGWDPSQVADLIKGLTYFERMFDRGFGSVPPVANLFRIYASMVDAEELDRFADWILRNTVNDYTPYGTSNHGARSLEELKKREAARVARKEATAAEERARFENARSQKIVQATERLPNALRRRDPKAVAALLAKGADPDSVGSSGQSGREIAQGLGIDAWLTGDEPKWP